MNKYPAFSTLREIILRGVYVCVNSFSKNSAERIKLLFCTGKWLNDLVGLRLIPFVGCLLFLTSLSLSLVVFPELKLHGLESRLTVSFLRNSNYSRGRSLA